MSSSAKLVIGLLKLELHVKVLGLPAFKLNNIPLSWVIFTLDGEG